MTLEKPDLSGRTAFVTGTTRGIGKALALALAEQGCNVVSTDRRKYGVVAGPGAKTGVNTSLAPGVVLSAGATTDPGESVLRDR